MRPRIFVALAIGLLLAACAGHPTPYQPAIEGFGYTQQQLDSRTWRVQFAGNIITPRETVENYLLYRCAEVMRFGGYSRFVLLDKEVERNVDYYGYGGGYSGGYYYGYGRRYGPAYYSPRNYSQAVSYSAIATIRVHSDDPVPGGGTVYDADEIIRQLGPTIVLPQPAQP